MEHIANSSAGTLTPRSNAGRSRSGSGFWWWGNSTSSASGTCYTPSERTVADQEPPAYDSNEPVAASIQRTAELETTISDLRNKNTQLENQVKSLTATINSSPPKPISRPVHVVIKSISFRDRYVSMNGANIRSFMHGGGGHVKVQTFVAGWEIFELVAHSEQNVVSFKSTCFDNVYIRADVQGLGRGHTPGHGGGLINCQYGCGNMEKFRLVCMGNQGEVAIEPADSPGRYLRLDGNWLHGVNMQGQANAWEKFWVVVVA